MERIELEPLEKRDIIEYLKYAKEQKKLNKKEVVITSKQTKRFDTTKYDIERIEQLINALNSKKERTKINKNDRLC